MNDAVVYVIDDDDAVRESLEFLLHTAQLRVRTYNSASSFLMSLPRTASGCIITDVRMPEISGTDLLKRLRDLDVKIPVIVVTGHGDVPLAVEAMKLGAVDFFEKPFDGDKVVAAVQTALKEKQQDADREAEKLDLLEPHWQSDAAGEGRSDGPGGRKSK